MHLTPLKLAGFALAARNCLWAQMERGGDEEIGGISSLLKCSTCTSAYPGGSSE